MIKIDGLEELHRWILNTDNRLRFNQPLMFHPTEVNQVISLVDKVADRVRNDYPFYASEMPQIVRNVFHPTQMGSYAFNSAAFGELFIITKHLHSEPQDSTAWLMIHPRIVGIAKEEYLDGHYASAANRSFVEVETRLRELLPYHLQTIGKAWMESSHGLTVSSLNLRLPQSVMKTVMAMSTIASAKWTQDHPGTS